MKNEEIVNAFRAQGHEAVADIVNEITANGPQCLEVPLSEAHYIAAGLVDSLSMKAAVVDSEGEFDHHAADFAGLDVANMTLVFEQDNLKIHMIAGTFNGVGAVLIFNPTPQTKALSNEFLDRGITVLLVEGES